MTETPKPASDPGAPSGLPHPDVEDQPLGPDPDEDAGDAALPGLPEGEPPTGG